MATRFKEAKLRRRALAVGASCVGLLAFAPRVRAGAITAPYSDNFDGDANGPAPNFTTTNGTWNVVNTGGSGTYQNSITTNIAASSTLQVTNLGATTGFTQSATVSTNATGAGNTNQFFGLAAMGTIADVSNSSGSNPNSTFYFADITGAGAMRIDKVVGGNSGTLLGSGAFANALVSGTNYTETFTGTYNGTGELDFAFTVSDGTNSQTITGSDTSSVLTGQFFGIRDRNATTGSYSATWDNYSLAPVPEPGTVAIMSLATLALISRRRRRDSGICSHDLLTA